MPLGVVLSTRRAAPATARLAFKVLDAATYSRVITLISGSRCQGSPTTSASNCTCGVAARWSPDRKPPVAPLPHRSRSAEGGGGAVTRPGLKCPAAPRPDSHQESRASCRYPRKPGVVAPHSLRDTAVRLGRRKAHDGSEKNAQTTDQGRTNAKVLSGALMTCRVLMVDDNENDRLFTRIALERSGVDFEIRAFERAEEALQMLAATPDHGIHLILLDINMPVMDGFGFLRAFEALPTAQRDHAVVVMLSSSSDPADRARAAAHKAAGQGGCGQADPSGPRTVNLGPTRRRWAFALWCVGILLSALAGWQAQQGNQQRLLEQTNRAADTLSQAIQERFRLYEYGLRGARGAIAASGGGMVTREQFKAYLDSRDSAKEFPGARGFGFIRRVARADEAQFLSRARDEGPADFSIRELAPHTADRFVIQYIYPTETNQGATGLDIASEPSRRAAATKAAREATAQLTAPTTLVQASGLARRGFLLLLPVYRDLLPNPPPAAREASTLGWTYAPLVVDEVLTDLKPHQHELSISLTDSAEQAPFFASQDTLTSDLVVVRQLSVQGREWVMHARPLPTLSAATTAGSPSMTVLAGAVMSSLLTLGLVWLLERRQFQGICTDTRRIRRPSCAAHWTCAQGQSAPRPATFLPRTLALRAGLGFAMALAFLTTFDYFQEIRAQHRQAALALQASVDSLARTAEGKYAERRRSLLFLANTPPVKGLIRALQQGGVDVQESSTTDQWQRRMQQIFAAYLEATPEAYRVRFVGAADEGREIVRVERLNGRVEVAPRERLQRKADTGFHRESLRLGEGNVFVSDVTLNRENDQVTEPHRPTIRYATPVHDAQGSVFGVIVINVDLTGRLGALAPGSGPRPRIFATNARGDFVAHPDAALTFGFDLG
eukprot:gene13843-29443_t